MSLKRPYFSFIFFFASLFLLLGCFGGVKKTGKVTGYQPGRVLTKKGGYQVGLLPEEWHRMKLEKALVALHNDRFDSTIATDAFCDQAYDDASLKILTRHLFDGLQNIKILQEQSMMLNERGALRTLLNATLDGAPVTLEIVVVKKDWCLFDFYLVSPQGHFAEAAKDFEVFYRGFSYTGDL